MNFDAVLVKRLYGTDHDYDSSLRRALLELAYPALHGSLSCAISVLLTGCGSARPSPLDAHEIGRTRAYVSRKRFRIAAPGRNRPR